MAIVASMTRDAARGRITQLRPAREQVALGQARRLAGTGRDGRSRSVGLAAWRSSWPDLAMKRVRIAELKDHLSEHLRAVERGAEIEVTDRSRPIARISPVPAAPRIVAATRTLASLRRRRARPARWAVSSLELLREERGER